MRNLLLLLTALFFSFSILAQKNKKKAIPEFGKVEKTELELKDCDFDKNAEAMVFLMPVNWPVSFHFPPWILN